MNRLPDDLQHSVRLDGCPYPLPHEEKRECIYCDKAVKYNVDKLIEKRTTNSTPMSPFLRESAFRDSLYGVLPSNYHSWVGSNAGNAQGWQTEAQLQSQIQSDNHQAHITGHGQLLVQQGQLGQQGQGMGSIAGRMAQIQPLMEAVLVSHDGAQQFLQSQANANLTMHGLQSAANYQQRDLVVQYPSNNTVLHYQGMNITSSPFIPNDQAWFLPNNEVITTPSIWTKIYNFLNNLLPYS